MKEKISEQQIIEAFLKTLEEYERIALQFQSNKNITIQNYSEKEYVNVQMKYMILRKYSSKKEFLYLPNVIDAGMNLYEDKKDLLESYQKKYEEVEKTRTRLVKTSIGPRKTLRSLQESFTFGLYLHSDERKLEKLSVVDEKIYYEKTGQYIENLEEVLFELYDVLHEKIMMKCKQELMDMAEKMTSVKSLPKNLNPLDREILIYSLLFLNEIRKRNFSIQVLEDLIYPPARSNWKDFSHLNAKFRNTNSRIGVSTKVQYFNDQKMAYVNLVQTELESSDPNKPPHTTLFCILTFIYKERKYGWRIYGIE